MAAAWFSRVGRALDAEESTRIAGILSGQVDSGSGPPSSAQSGAQSGAQPSPQPNAQSGALVEIEVVRGAALSRILLAEEHDSLWWDAEESERERLWEIAAERATEAIVAERLSTNHDERVAIQHAAAVVGNAAAIDASHIPAAIEAAMLSLHQNALADLADMPAGHWFRIKRALFETGRWPLGFRSGRLHIV